MGKQSKSAIGKGKVTPVQVAFIVDRYLSDNNFLQTRSSFRSEAQHLISKSPVREAPRSLLSLVDMLDEYICLKEQKLILNQEKTRLDIEKVRVQNLLRGMQNVMNSYNSSAPPSTMVTPLIAKSSLTTTTTTATTAPSNSPAATAASVPVQAAASKRTRNATDSGPSSKRSRAQPSSLKSTATAKTVLPNSNPSTKPTSSLQGSTVAKRLFNPAPKTPSPSPTQKPSTPVDNQTTPVTNSKTLLTPHFTSTNRTVITSETVQVSPMKQVSYYSIERNQCISSPNKRFTKRDHVKGRLDFDTSETTTTVNSDTFASDHNTSEDDAFDFDLSNFDCLGTDFNLTDLLGDFDLGGFCKTDNGSSPESHSG